MKITKTMIAINLLPHKMFKTVYYNITPVLWYNANTNLRMSVCNIVEKQITSHIVIESLNNR